MNIMHEILNMNLMCQNTSTSVKKQLHTVKNRKHCIIV